MIWHVAKNGREGNNGSKEHPFPAISLAAEVARAGDVVCVHEGVYREWVSPRYGGKDDHRRIVYEAAPGEKVVIKGSEVVKGWKEEGNIWRISFADSFFGDCNPFRRTLFGDWLVSPLDPPLHTAGIYLAGKAMTEVPTIDAVREPKAREYGCLLGHLGDKGRVYLCHPEVTLLCWHGEWKDGITTIWANFQGRDPNRETVEVTVRPTCFFPRCEQRNFITVRGFEMAQAATQWAPPTTFQEGLLGVNWSKGWIIENNDIHDSTCVGISLGKKQSPEDNASTRDRQKPGYQCQLESVFRACNEGWCKDLVGSHIVRNNRIHDCGQAGIAGHLGCAFSLIEHNEIWNIDQTYAFFGHEIAGIKFHAAIDVQIMRNAIHHCALGLWLDWETQGTRLSGNLLWENVRDLMVEVSHGPYILDNNIFASNSLSFENASQGGAFVHNLFAAPLRHLTVPDRSTPYHYPHDTQIKGCAVVYGGDDRVFQNIFLGGKEMPPRIWNGTRGYEGHPASTAEYQKRLAEEVFGDVAVFAKIPDPVWVRGNAYYDGANACSTEKEKVACEETASLRIEQEDDGVYLEIDIPEQLWRLPTHLISTREMEAPRIVDEPFEDPEGRDILFDRDFLGHKRHMHPFSGPLEEVRPGHNRIKIWQWDPEEGY